MKKFPDSLLMPVMAKHNITKEEADLRMQLLSKTGIMEQFNPDDPECQQMVDDFLSLTPEEGAAKIIYEQILYRCLEDKKFVSNYSRLNNKSFAAILKQMQAGIDTKELRKEYKKFADFVRSVVFDRFEKPYLNLIDLNK